MQCRWVPVRGRAESLVVSRSDGPEQEGASAPDEAQVAVTISGAGDGEPGKSLYERADSARESLAGGGGAGPRVSSDQWASRAFSQAMSEEQGVEDAWTFNQVYFMGR